MALKYLPLLAALGAIQGVVAQLEAVAPLSRLASWSKVTVGTTPSNCLAASTPGESLFTRVYYQSPDNHLREACRNPGVNTWTHGTLSGGRPVTAAPNSPLAVLHWTDGGNNDVITLWYADAAQQLTEKRFQNGTWGADRDLGVKVHINPSVPGSIAAVAESPSGWVSVIYRDDINRVSVCRYLWSDLTMKCSAGVITSFDTALDGTSTAAFLDTDGPHLFYQATSTSVINAAIELVPNGTAKWFLKTGFRNTAQGVQFAGYRGRYPGGELQRFMLATTTDNNNVISQTYSRDYCGGWCTCYAATTPAVTSTIVGLAVSSCTSNQKAYWVTGSKIAEMTVEPVKGWQLSNGNILA
ncbi:hypothetical protein QBC35DRAFT_479050 [Podospora australis]|uniref:Fucose-specific lectin n=1 Tax=Podospora australis TaxID=1536484 RepID=A0AAN6WLR0_9PEZI|nr:hypothetical protein QBC35DRAFT_479050 [Podospora australis]